MTALPPALSAKDKKPRSPKKTKTPTKLVPIVPEPVNASRIVPHHSGITTLKSLLRSTKREIERIPRKGDYLKMNSKRLQDKKSSVPADFTKKKSPQKDSGLINAGN